MSAWYNEIDPYAAQWLRNLISAGHIAPGEVDERSVEDVAPADIRGFRQCHFFAGIGIWSLALRNAGWPDDRPVWTGSCPCQPFSAAGKGEGFADERHLWPAWHHLIRFCRPGLVFGEQVASKDGLGWLDLVSADMEAEGYALGAFDLCAAGIGAPHIRQRLWFVGVADADDAGQRGEPVARLRRAEVHDADGRGERSRLADTYHAGSQGRGKRGHCADQRALGSNGMAGRLADSGCELHERLRGPGKASGAPGAPAAEARERERGWAPDRAGSASGVTLAAGPVNGFWRDADWLFCRDGKWRPVEARPQPMVDGSAESLGRVCPEIIAKIEEEVTSLAMEVEDCGATLLRNLREALASEAPRIWTIGGLPGLHEAPFLLAFLRQLQEQGWRFSERDALPRTKVEEDEVRGLRCDRPVTGAPHQRRLDGQPTREHPDPLHLLSSLLARHAHSAWGRAYEAYAEIGFPLGHNIPARVGRLRAYGNGIVAPLAQTFIESVMECMP